MYVVICLSVSMRVPGKNLKRLEAAWSRLGAVLEPARADNPEAGSEPVLKAEPSR